MVNVLLEHRADVANLDQSGFNALDLAIENGHRYITLPLLQVETLARYITLPLLQVEMLVISGLLTISPAPREGWGWRRG